MSYLNIDWLKQNHQMIHYFGLGFIQLKIDDRCRMHFYTPELPPIVSEEDVHNHRYNFDSKILKGEFTQELFHVIEGNSHIREHESCKEGVEAATVGTPCGIILASAHTYFTGSSYFINHKTFHRVIAKNCITLLNRGSYKKDMAEVIRLVDAKKICPFSQKVEEEQLWEIVERMLQECPLSM